MCDTCGCGNTNEIKYSIPGKNNNEDVNPKAHLHNHHEHDNDHDHNHSHNHSHELKIDLDLDVLYKNNLTAQRNRGFFEAKNIFAINFVSSPGSGKTTLLEKTINELKNKYSIAVIEGDQQTMNDANRISATGVPVIQINTGSGCHLDAEMINKAINKLDLPNNSILFIENVGNLVCPALFDLGEAKRVVIMSVTEGEDKPLKYPYMFQTSHVCLINKNDLLPYLDFNIDDTKKYLMQVNHHLKLILLSLKSGDGFDQWIEWITNEIS
jgi:hydrogenase nickel incorporation protein HypB